MFIKSTTIVAGVFIPHEMNVLIDSDCYTTARYVASRISLVTGQKIVKYDYSAARSLSTRTGIVFSDSVKYIVIGAPKSVDDYRKLSADGFNPDRVIYVSTNVYSWWVRNVDDYYEGQLESYIHPAISNVTNCVINSLVDMHA